MLSGCIERVRAEKVDWEGVLLRFASVNAASVLVNCNSISSIRFFIFSISRRKLSFSRI